MIVITEARRTKIIQRALHREGTEACTILADIERFERAQANPTDDAVRAWLQALQRRYAMLVRLSPP